MIARKVMRDVRNRWSYEEVENFVRDATSNTNDPPSPAQIRQIGDSMLYYESYPKAFGMLWRRLTHLEYKRHVAKALLVLDTLVRIRPPSKAVQLRLMVDCRERWPEIWRLAQLRPSSSSETIAQIQRVAERLCQFIMGYESGYILPEETEESEEEEDIETRRRRKMKRQRRKRRTTVEEEEEQADNEAAEEEDDDEEDDESHLESAAPSAAPPPLSKPALPPMSPFGFDFFTHTNFEWQPAPSAVPPSQPAQQTQPQPSTWQCPACTFINPEDKDKCEICGEGRHEDTDSKSNHAHAQQHEAKSDSSSTSDDKAWLASTWACEACSFRNKMEAEQCEVCETKRGAKGRTGETSTEDGSEGGARVGESQSGEGKDGDEKEGHSDLSSLSSLSDGSSDDGNTSDSSSTTGGGQISGSWACSWCSWLNPPTAIVCEVCEREGKRSGMAQLVKLEMARKYEQKQADGAQAARTSWSCSVCTFVNRKRASTRSFASTPSAHLCGDRRCRGPSD